MMLNIFYIVLAGAIAAFISYLVTKKKLFKQLGKENEELKNSLRNKENEIEFLKKKQTKFWNVISQELKTLFYSFYNSIDLLNTGYDDLRDDEKRQLINNIGRSYDQTLGIINELLEWVKANRRRQDTAPQYINLSLLVEDNLSGLSGKIDKKEIRVEKEIGENIPIYGDKMMINFVINSLLSNAIKFSNRNGIIRISCNKIGNRAELVISDNGVGIPKENFEKLFNLDDILTTSGTENEKGSGLGLMICKDFVEVNNGKLTLNSEFGKGTTVSIILQGTEN
jgi:two-component system, sensor histidine kinase and response regulator